jgi:DNA-binding MarR family transcriptional regulator
MTTQPQKAKPARATSSARHHGCAGDAIGRQAIRTAYDVRLAPLGLTLSLASLLAYVADFGPVNQTRAAEHLGQGRASTGAQVDRLEQLGHVARLPDPDDRRVWMVAITPSGRELVDQVTEIDAVLRAELRSGISRSERQQLAAVQSYVCTRNLVSADSGRQPEPQNPKERDMTDPVIVGAIRTPGSKRNGKLKDWHPVDLAARPQALQQRNDLDPALVDDVVMGCVMQVGQQSLNIGRNAVLPQAGPNRCRRRRSTASAAPANRRCTSPPRA